MEEKILYKDLSYKIIGVIFDVYNEIGGKHYERYIQKAIANSFDKIGIKYKREVKAPLICNDKQVGFYKLDFIIEDKIVLEIKRGYRFSKQDFKQVSAYLKANNFKLGILVLFTDTKVKFTRVLNLY